MSPRSDLMVTYKKRKETRSRIWDYKKTMKKVGDNQDDYHVLSRTKEG